MSGAGLSPEIRGRLFVVGAPRSGTTLLQGLLAAHGATTSFTESHFFDRHFRTLPGARALLVRNPAARLREFLAENGEEWPPAAGELLAARRRGLAAALPLPLRTRATARLLLRVLDELALRRERAVWIEKTPRHLRYVPFLERLCGPRAGLRFVHLVRDGLEVAASLRQASRGWERPYDLGSCVERWNVDLALSVDRIGSPRDHFVLYEELAARPEATLRRLFVELELGWEPRLLERYAAAAESLVAPGEEAWKADVGRAIRPSATSDRALSEEERRLAAGSLRRDLYERLREHAARPAPASGGGSG